MNELNINYQFLFSDNDDQDVNPDLQEVNFGAYHDGPAQFDYGLDPITGKDLGQAGPSTAADFPPPPPPQPSGHVPDHEDVLQLAHR